MIFNRTERPDTGDGFDGINFKLQLMFGVSGMISAASLICIGTYFVIKKLKEKCRSQALVGIGHTPSLDDRHNGLELSTLESESVDTEQVEETPLLEIVPLTKAALIRHEALDPYYAPRTLMAIPAWLSAVPFGVAPPEYASLMETPERISNEAVHASGDTSTLSSNVSSNLSDPLLDNVTRSAVCVIS